MPRFAWFLPPLERLLVLWGPRRTTPRRSRPQRRLRLEPLEDRTVLSPTLVTEIKQTTASSNPSSLVNVGGELFFAANDGVHGTQLWETDGSADGTVMLTDLNAGVAPAGFNPQFLTDVNSTLFFTANDGVHGNELWESDGTPEGTALVKDINPGPAGSFPTSLVNADGTLYFVARDAQGSKLWQSDGTAAGTVPIPRTNFLQPRGLTALGATLFFVSDNGFQRPLYRLDGTTLRDVFDGTASGLTAAGDKLFFTAPAASGGGATTLFVEGSSPTARPVDLANFGGPNHLTNVSGELFFTENYGTLWESDGTSAGTRRVAAFPGGPYGAALSWLTDVNGTLYLAVDAGQGGHLWKSDGTQAGTVEVSAADGTGPLNPYGLLNINGTLFFNAGDPSSGVGLWTSDGTADGTQRIADISALGGYLVNAGGTAYFPANDGVHGIELWESDGTADGTRLVTDINATALHSSPSHLTAVNGTLYFTASDGVNGDHLYTTDGTAAGTVALTNDPGGSNPHGLIDVNGTLYFSASDSVHGTVLWQSDGTPEGTAPILGALGGKFLTSFNGAIYYVGFQQGHGSQMWKSDGTAAGTAPITDFNTSYFFGFDPGPFTLFQGALYFSATDGQHGYQLWKSDGTAAGTVMLTSVNSLGGIYPRLLTLVNGELYFEAIVNNAVQLWKSDGTAAGTAAVATVYTVNLTNAGRETLSIGDTLYFTIGESAGTRLWKTDGTARGTVALGFLPLITSLADYGGTLYFAGFEPATGYQLWKSDGTAAGTVRVTDVNPTRGGLGFIPQLLVADGRLLFAGSDGVHGRELWVSDGTADGTHMLADINPGPASSNPSELTAVDGVVYFTANDGKHGVSLWKVGAVTDSVRTVVSPTATAGEAFTVTVQALNDFGGIDPNYRGTMHFDSSDSRANLPDDYTFTGDDAGSHTFTDVTLFQAGEQTLTVSDPGDADLTDTATVQVAPASVAGFTVVATGPVYAGQPFQLTVTALDAYGNVVTDYQGDVLLLSFFNTTDLPSDYRFTADDAGSHTFSATADHAGLLVLVVADAEAGAWGYTVLRVQPGG